MNIGIVGLGLIGGSLAASIKQNTKYNVFGYDIDNNTQMEAINLGYIDDILDDNLLLQCDIVLIALYPKATIEYVLSKASLFKANAIIVDCAGVKKELCYEIWDATKECNFTFIGGHPMAGKQFSGIKHALSTLFNNASMILTPKEGSKYPGILNTLFTQIGCNIVVSTPDEHDKIIAYTSQLAHVVSNSYIKSETSKKHHGYSAGSYNDLTRVALLNENMWTELFIANSDNLSKEIDVLISNLNEINIAIKNKDEKSVWKLLNDGNELKKKVDS